MTPIILLHRAPKTVLQLLPPLVCDSFGPPSNHSRLCGTSRIKSSRTDIWPLALKIHSFASNTESLITPGPFAWQCCSSFQQVSQPPNPRVYPYFATLGPVSDGIVHFIRNWFILAPTRPARSTASKTRSIHTYGPQLTRYGCRLFGFPRNLSELLPCCTLANTPIPAP